MWRLKQSSSCSSARARAARQHRSRARILRQSSRHGEKAAERPSALRQLAHVLDFLAQVGLVAGQAASDLGKLCHNQYGQHTDEDESA